MNKNVSKEKYENVFMKIASFRKKYSILVAFFSLVFFASVFSIHYLLQEIQEKNENIYKRLADARWQEDRLRTMSDIREHQKKMDAFGEIFTANILKEGEEIIFISFLEEISNKSDVDMVIRMHQPVALNISKKEKELEKEKLSLYGEDNVPFDVEIELSGGYDENMQFLYLLENAPTIVHIQSVSLEQRESDKNEKIPLAGSGVFQKNIDPTEEGGEEEKNFSSEEFIMNVVARIYVYKEKVQDENIKKEEETQK
jgi:hypothetical protein